MEKVTVVTTVLNEERSTEKLIESLLTQTREADEIVMVDGGSTDRTVEIIRGYQLKEKKIRLIEEKGSIAHGRNVAVRAARSEIVAQIDGGCVAREDWIAQIMKPFEDQKVGVVAGFYLMTGKSSFQEAVATYFGVPPGRYDRRVFMPSARSVAFRKGVWKKVGGYSESLERAGEDTLFNYKVLKEGIKMVRVKEAVVYWELPESWYDAMGKWYSYAKGDGQAMIWWHPAQRYSTHSVRVMTVYARYIAAAALLMMGKMERICWFVLVILAVVYGGWVIEKNKDVVRSFRAKLWLPAVQVSCDLMVMAGFITGLVTRKR